MKKGMILFLFILLVVGCESIMNTPTSKVEAFFQKYQNLDSDVLKELDAILKIEESFTSKQKDQYKSLFLKQYQNLSYEVMKEEITSNRAIVEVEIEVLDYKDAVDRLEDYYLEHPEDFQTEEEYIEEKIKAMEKVEETIKYQLTMNLEKRKGKWQIEVLTDVNRQKIHGLY